MDYFFIPKFYCVSCSTRTHNMRNDSIKRLTLVPSIYIHAFTVRYATQP